MALLSHVENEYLFNYFLVSMFNNTWKALLVQQLADVSLVII